MEIVPVLTMLALKLVTAISMPLATANPLVLFANADEETVPLLVTTPRNSVPLSSMPMAVAALPPVAVAETVPRHCS